MRFNSVRTGNYAQSAQAVTRASDKIYDAAMSGKPDFTKISKAAIEGRSAERRAVTKAEGNVAKAGLEAFTYAKRTKNAVETEKAIADIKRPAKRMAGIVGGLGAIATGYVGMQESKKAKAERDELRAYRDELDAKQDANDAASEARYQAFIDSFKNKPDSTEVPETKPSASGSTPLASKSTPAPSSEPSSTKVQPVGNISSTFKGDPKSAFGKIYTIAKKVGGAKFPEIVAAQAMHETGYLNPNLKSVYNSSGGTNPFGQTGDRGYGTIPREGFKDGWTKYPDLETAVKDHIKLWHDTKNHSGNYNAFSTRREGIASVTPSYSPNADPVNIKKGFTEDKYSSSMRKILEDNGFSF